MSAAIEDVYTALVGRRSEAEVVKAAEGDELDWQVFVKNVCQWDRSYLALERAITAIGLTWEKAIRAVLEYVKKKRPAPTPLFAS